MLGSHLRRPSDVEKGVAETSGEASPKGSIHAPPGRTQFSSSQLGQRLKTLTFRMTGHGKAAPNIPSRRRYDILSRQDHQIQLSADEIMKCTSDHKEYSIGAVKLKGLAKFDDATAYGVTEDQEKDLIRKEVQKLISYATSEQPLLFSSRGILGKTDVKGFDALCALGDQILCNFQIIKHDNYRHVVEKCPAFSFEAIKGFKSSRKHLLKRYRNDKNHVEGRQPRVLDDPQQNMEAYFALVDYAFGIMAWWLVRVADNNFWKNQLFAILAQWVVKLKAVSFDPARCAESSLSDGEDLMRQMTSDLSIQDPLILKLRVSGDSNDSDRKSVEVLDEESDLSSWYYLVKMYLRSDLERILWNVVGSVLAEERTGNNSATFEVCALVYKTGLDRILTLLTSDREGDVSASSDLGQVGYSYSAFQLLFRNTKEMQRRQGEQGEPVDRNIATRFRWREGEAVDADPKTTEIRLERIDQIVSLLLPFSMSCAAPAYWMQSLVQTVSSASDQEDQLRQFEAPSKKFEAEFTISTQEWLDKQHRMSQKFHDPDVVPVSGAPMKLGIRAGTEVGRIMNWTPGQSLYATTKDRAARILDEYREHKQVMDGWIVAERSITVYCRIYSRFFLFFAIFLVLGSLAIPFSVQDRLPGVDPFQFVQFMWLLAGFTLIAAKSRYVSNWPWHDFLKGQVICRSVKDLADVTGIDPQMILLFLLQNEFKHTLSVSGPYTGMFLRVAEAGDAFEINEAAQLSTMLASGFLIFKVLNEKGEHLICLDVRKNARRIIGRETAEYNASMAIGQDMVDEEELVASDQASTASTSSAQKPAPAKAHERRDKVIMLRGEEFSWNKMLGLYIKDSRFG